MHSPPPEHQASVFWANLQRNEAFKFSLIMLPVSEGVVRTERPVIPLPPVGVIGGLHDGVVPGADQDLIRDMSWVIVCCFH